MNLSGSVVPVLYDKEGNEVDTTRLTISNSTVTVSVNILATKEVELKLSTVGTLAPNRFVVGITSDPAKVRLKGTSTVLNAITTLEIPDINVAGASSDVGGGLSMGTVCSTSLVFWNRIIRTCKTFK